MHGETCRREPGSSLVGVNARASNSVATNFLETGFVSLLRPGDKEMCLQAGQQDAVPMADYAQKFQERVGKGKQNSRTRLLVAPVWAPQLISPQMGELLAAR